MSLGNGAARALLLLALGSSSSACRVATADGASSPPPAESAVARLPSATLSLPPTVARPAAAPADVALPPPDARREGCGSVSRLLTAGTGAARPSDDDQVVLEYATFARSGQPLDSSATHDEPTVESVRQLPPGLACVVKRMSVGESRRVWLPATLETTQREAPSSGAPVALTIDITLRKVMRAPKRPDDYAAPPRAAQRTASGLSFLPLHRGTGQRRPVGNSRVTIYHSGWTNRGVLFESSLLAGQPASYLTYELPNGLSEGIQLMHVGDKLRFWLPERSAYASANRNAPKGPVVFDVELLAID